ncbi:hypothetical protein A374_13050 [Fictibacillus macauensis ZFHKF-1]|uniref:Uncharacterized protein n=1 Tax=Fictibacillus macauensis ZFHKF-1 TaxID=1196324 RepID=I8UDL1_9BACL|nr:hypothetical protein [Fictibacillus macauensis]EIT84975.1 hypothetical protein A374_13050 [Fictibacillus macauensis ZFHKF-1]
MEDTYLYRTDELENAVDYLEKAAFYYNIHDKHRFKWLMISLHGALYGFGVCNIKGTSVDNVLNKPKTKNIPEYILKTKQYYKDKFELEIDDNFASQIYKYFHIDILNFGTVINRCKSTDYMTRNIESKILKLSKKQEEAIEKLKRYRNSMAHFKPSSYIVTEDYDKEIVIPVIGIIEFLAFETNNVPYDIYDDDFEVRIKTALGKFG